MGKFVYGPVPSRRLGRSLGIDLLRPKICTVNCVYCQIGSYPPLPPVRKRFVNPEYIEHELAEAIRPKPRIDYITFSGSGEPTLSSDLGRLVNFAKSLRSAPVCVLTNGTLLSHPDVKEELAAADVIIPNLDAANARVFKKVNRPHPDIKFDEYLEGLETYAREFSGKFFIEIVLVKGMNDSEEHLEELAARIERIDPDGVWIGTVTRPPAETVAKPVTKETLGKARRIIGERAQTISAFHSDDTGSFYGELTENILALLIRRPETVENISKSLGANPHEVTKVIAQLVEDGTIRRRDMSGKTYFEYVKN